MKKTPFLFVAAAAALTAFSSPTKIIFDTDMYTDFDDVGALATLHALADAGECEILGTVVSTRGTPSLGMVEIVNDFYGRPDIPVGANRELGIGPFDKPQRSYDLYLDMVKTRKDVVKHPTSDTAPDANDTYRRILAAQPDGSVTICSVGFTTNMRRLLETKGDAISPLGGRELVAKKVKAWYAMACCYPNGYEYNSKEDGESSKIAFRDWPTPIYFLDVNYGRSVKCGVPASRLVTPVNPVRDVFKRALREYNEADAGHPSWDEITVLAAVRGWQRYFGTVRGRFDIVDAKGKNAWTPDPNGNHFVLTVKTPKDEVGRIVDELMTRAPKNKANASANTACDKGLLPAGSFRIRDPFVLADNGTYYLYEAKPWSGGREVNVFTSKDLKSWTPKVPVMKVPDSNACTAIWAPEVHRYAGSYWLFTTLTFPEDPKHPIKDMAPKGGKKRPPLRPRGVWVFKSDSPMGPFKPVKEGSVTPADWMCLDGTLWVEDGRPWMVFCHEWVQTGTGRMMAAPLSDDLSRFIAEPIELFRATDVTNGGVVTDGPFLHRAKKGGALRMIWSNMIKGKGYSVIQCKSESGKIKGPWVMHTPLYAKDGGHGMLFRTFEGQLMLTLHQPNKSPEERMHLYPIYETWAALAREDWDPFGPAWHAQWTPKLEKEIDERIERHRKADAFVDGLPPNAEVKVEQVSSEFLVGSNMFNFDQLGCDAWNAEYRAAFTNLFNAGTIAFYWKNVEPELGEFRYKSGPRDQPEFWNKFDFEKDDPYRFTEWRRPAPDRLIDFCKANGVAMHGHAIIYVAWSPDWLWKLADTPARARHWYDRHVYDMALYYGDAIPQWDIVNESLNRTSTREAPDDAGNWFAAQRKGVVLPPDYTRRAFELSERLFPKNVRLAINDAWTIRNDAYAAFAQKLIRDGAKINIVGYQKHIFNPRDLLTVVSGYPCLTNGQTWDVADEISHLAEIDARTGRPIHISEVTIPSPRGLAGLTDAQADEIQARAMRAFYRLWFSWPSVERITYWNLVDGLGAKNERMSSGWFNRDMTKKPVWHTMNKLFNHEWRTSLTARADANGRLAFRGFKGRYRLTWRNKDGTTATRELTLSSKTR